MKTFLLATLFYSLFLIAFIYRLYINFSNKYIDNIKKIVSPHVKSKIFEMILFDEPMFEIYIFSFALIRLPMYIIAPHVINKMLLCESLCNWNTFFYLLMIAIPITKIIIYTYVKNIIDDEINKQAGGIAKFDSNEIEICSTGDTYDENELCFKAYTLRYFTSYKNEVLKEHKFKMVFSDKTIIEEIINYKNNIYASLEEYDLHTLSVKAQKELLKYLNINEDESDIILNMPLKYDVIEVDNHNILLICGCNKKLKNEKRYQFLCFAYFDKSMKRESVDEDGTCHYKCDYKVLADYSFKQLMKKIKKYDGEF